MNIQLPVAKRAVNTLQGLDASEVAAPIQNATVQIDRPDVAYVAAYPSAGLHGHIVIPKNPSQIGTVTVTVTAQANDAQGNPIPASTFQYDIVGAPPPPPATHDAFGTPVVGSFFGEPGDPGPGPQAV